MQYSYTVAKTNARIIGCLMPPLTIALMPVSLLNDRGSDEAKAMVWPVIGGMAVELLTLFVVPIVYAGFKEFKMNLGMDDRHWAGADD